MVTHGLSGKVGDMLVFSQRNGKTIVSKIPNRTAPQSDAQIQHLQKFQEAVIYAKSVMADPTTKAAYAAKAQGGVTAYNVAVADLLNAPNIESINLSAYTGKIGDKIIIRATDDFKVTKVTVTIENLTDGSGTLISRTLQFAGSLTVAEQQRLLEIANKCPVHKMLTGTIHITTTIATT